jgi:hypothetical protein
LIGVGLGGSCQLLETFGKHEKTSPRPSPYRMGGLKNPGEVETRFHATFSGEQ